MQLVSFCDPKFLIQLFVGLVVLILIKHLVEIRRLPPGPFPLPFIGNLLSFRGRKAINVFKEFSRKHGSVYTVWLGTQKTVVVSGYHLIRQGLVERRNEFAGRPTSLITEMLLRNSQGITLTDISPIWEYLRKTLHAVVRKYAASNQLPILVDEVVEENVGHMMSRRHDPFDPGHYTYLLTFSITMSSLISRRFKMDDAEYLNFIERHKKLQKLSGNGLPSDLAPILRPFYRQREGQIKQAVDKMYSFIFEILEEHKTSYKQGTTRDILDTLLTAKNTKDENVRLDDGNIAVVMYDFITAAVATTETTIRWILLYLATYPLIQQKVIDEIKNQIGTRVPVLDDRKQCPYTCAVIAETMRIRTVVPFSLPRKTTTSTNFGGYFIPKDTRVLFHVETAHLDDRHWDDPEVFRPERFLNGDLFTTETLSHYLPFSQGRRSCIGEKLATAVIFMILTGILKRCRMVMASPPEDLEPMDLARFCFPKEHKVVAQKLP